MTDTDRCAPSIPDGYHPLAASKVAVVVTYLEMLARPAESARPAPEWPIRRVVRPDADWYRDLFRRIGTDWLWFSRLRLSDEALLGIIRDPAVAIFALARDGRDEGLLELDFRQPGACELAFFGVTAPLIGTGAAWALMHRAIEEAWTRPIKRFWVHTCTGDHPAAVPFYIRSGFVPYARAIEIADDPRLLGLFPRDAAPHIPVLGGD
ncbi:MAG TPA: GNAT family N-acetyltransferase [Hyphomicrobiaceae bacterium]|nr:GNAT family N-acetyltransferase [Hyphomicrobiaceae bacterium]